MPNCAAIIAGAQAASDAVVSACIAQAATIDAARIQAKAAAQSGHWTLIAAGIAFFSALYAAQAPGIRERSERYRLTRAYRYRMHQLISGIAAHVGSCEEEIQHRIYALENSQEPPSVCLAELTRPHEIDSDKWRDHALLTTSEIQAIMELDYWYPSAEELNKWREGLNGKDLTFVRSYAVTFSIFSSSCKRANKVLTERFLQSQMEIDWEDERRKLRRDAVGALDGIFMLISKTRERLRSALGRSKL